MNYPIAIHKDPDSDYGVTVPDLPGCFSAGTTIDEAMAMAKEAIELHLESMMDDGESVPQPSDIETLSQRDGLNDAMWAIVTVKLPTMRASA